jgi:hypothetical protein
MEITWTIIKNYFDLDVLFTDTDFLVLVRIGGGLYKPFFSYNFKFYERGMWRSGFAAFLIRLHKHQKPLLH